MRPGSGSEQFKYRNLGSGAEPDRKTSNPDAAVHVDLRATFFVQAPDVGYPHQATEVEPAVHEIERDLAAAVNVAGQRQIDTQLGMMIEEMRVVGEQNVNGIRHHQRFELLQSPVRHPTGWVRAPVAAYGYLERRTSE